MRVGSVVLAGLGVLALVAPAVSADGSGTDNSALLGVPDASPGVAPRETIGDGGLDLDWSVGLRGAYTTGTLGSGAEVILAPEFTLNIPGNLLRPTITGDSELVLNDNGVVRIDVLHLGAQSLFEIDPWTSGTASVDGIVSQPDVDDPELPTNTAIAPITFEGSVDASLTRKLGQFEVTARGELGRTIVGPTTLDDSSEIDNSAESSWTAGAGLRVGYRVTPVGTVFVDGSFAATKYDAMSPSLLVFLDGSTYAAKMGATYTPNDLLSAEASIGYGWLDYIDGSLSDAASWTYDASVTFKPDETLALTGGLSTTLGPSASVPGDTAVTYELTGSANYVVNPWLTLRGSADLGFSYVLGTGDESTDVGAGVGADFATSDHVAITADYSYARTDAPPDPVDETHMIALGVKVSR